jgi:pyruvate kinase
VWGVTPLVIPQGERTTQTFQAAMVKAKELDLLKEGDLVVQSAGTHTGVSGSTDLVKVSIVGNEAEATLI